MAKGKRRQKRQRLYQIWRYKKRSILCLRCLRIIKRGDIFRTEIFYDGEGAVAADTHVFCSDVRHRPRLRAPAQPEVITMSGEPRRKMIMSADTTTVQNSENTTDVAAEDKPKKKPSSKKTVSKKASAKTSNKESKMSATKKSSKKASKKTAAKKTSKNKKGAATSNGNGRSLAVTVGNRLEPLMKGNKKTASIIKALSAGKDVSHKQLVTLRDEIKEQAAALREKGNGSKASELSAANALVRRLERAAR